MTSQTAQATRPGSLHPSFDQARIAAEEMRRAAGAMGQGQRREARNRGESASRSLDPLGDQLERQRQQLQQQWRKEVAQSMDQALAETSRLAERQLKVQEDLQRGEPDAATCAEQAAIEEGVKKILEQMKQASGKNALVSPQIAAALGAAQLQMREAREAISSA